MNELQPLSLKSEEMVLDPATAEAMRFQTVTLDADASPLLKELERLSTAQRIPEELREALVRLIDGPSELVSFHVDQRAAGAGQLRIRLEPSDAFRDLVTACLARDGN